MEEEDVDDCLEIFVLEHAIEGPNNTFSCTFCGKSKKIKYSRLHKHFIDNHEKEFKAFFGDEGRLLSSGLGRNSGSLREHER